MFQNYFVLILTVIQVKMVKCVPMNNNIFTIHMKFVLLLHLRYLTVLSHSGCMQSNVLTPIGTDDIALTVKIRLSIFTRNLTICSSCVIRISTPRPPPIFSEKNIAKLIQYSECLCITTKHYCHSNQCEVHSRLTHI